MEEQKMNENNFNHNVQSPSHQQKSLHEKKMIDIINKELTKRNFVFNLFMIFLTIFFLIISTLLVLSFLNFFEIIETKEWKVPIFLLQIWFTIPIFLTNFLFLFFFIINRYRFLKEKKIYYQSKKDFDLQRVPTFIISKYKNYLTIRIFFNWFLIPLHFLVISLILSIYLWFFAKIQQQVDWALTQEFFNYVNNFWSQKFWLEDSNKEIILVLVCIAWVFLIILQVIVNFILTRKKINIEIIFDLKQKIDFGEIRSHTRKTNLIAFLFVFLPLIIIFLFYKIGKKIKK